MSKTGATDKRIVEIGGHKFEIDMRTAVAIDNFRIGDKVKVLVKNYSEYKSYPGIVVGFDDFKELPTITVLYLKVDYGDAELRYAYINSQSKDVEICKDYNNDSGIPIQMKETILSKIDKAILIKTDEIDSLKEKKAYIETNFGKFFAEVTG